MLHGASFVYGRACDPAGWSGFEGLCQEKEAKFSLNLEVENPPPD
jgi:hypothetical protein